MSNQYKLNERFSVQLPDGFQLKTFSDKEIVRQQELTQSSEALMTDAGRLAQKERDADKVMGNTLKSAIVNELQILTVISHK